MPGFPLLHNILEFAQTHVHRVGDATNHLTLCHAEHCAGPMKQTPLQQGLQARSFFPVLMQ